MGGLFGKVWTRMLGKKEMRILMVGLDAAGKTKHLVPSRLCWNCRAILERTPNDLADVVWRGCVAIVRDYQGQRKIERRQQCLGRLYRPRERSPCRRRSAGMTKSPMLAVWGGHREDRLATRRYRPRRRFGAVVLRLPRRKAYLRERLASRGARLRQRLPKIGMDIRRSTVPNLYRRRNRPRLRFQLAVLA